MGTRDRIIQASVELFNRRGVRSVTTNHIAAHLSISPGNLYYHFRNKEEIIRSIFPRVAETARAALALPQGRPVVAEDVGRCHLRGVEGLWEFRFFFRDLHELLARDSTLARSYRELQTWLIQEFSVLFDRMIAQGEMSPPDPPSDLERIATNASMLWTSWINFVATLRRSEIRPSDIVDGALQGFLSIAPYLDRDFAREVRAAILMLSGEGRS
jgi:AcrR family transcriptional regulator